MKRKLFVGLLVALALAGAILYSSKVEGDAEVTEVATIDFLELKQGWNLVVWPADTQLVQSAFASIADYHLVVAYGWQDDTQSFSRYVPRRPEVSDLSQVEKNTAYWLLMRGEFLLVMPPSASECQGLTDYLLSDACTGAKLNMELGELTDIDVGASEQFFSENCQGVSLLEGSPVADACAWAGVVLGASLAMGDAFEAQQARALMERYCAP